MKFINVSNILNFYVELKKVRPSFNMSYNWDIKYCMGPFRDIIIENRNNEIFISFLKALLSILNDNTNADKGDILTYEGYLAVRQRVEMVLSNPKVPEPLKIRVNASKFAQYQ